jgi:predicted ATPase
MFRGISQAHLGNFEGIQTLHHGISLTGARWALPYWLTEIASVPGQKLEVARATLADASATAEETGEVWNAAELSREAGNLARAGDWVDATEVEKHYQTARRIARRQGAKLLELRAAISLARLWRDRGKRTEAGDLLAPVYSWFTEGFDTVDLNEARALLAELA